MTEKEYKCEKCQSKNVIKTCHPNGEVSYITCTECGHVTQYFHITEEGREILKELLGEE